MMDETKGIFNLDFVQKRLKVHTRQQMDDLIDEFLNDCLIALANSKVWPADAEILGAELITACNYIIAAAGKLIGGQRECQRLTGVNDMMMSVLHRVLLFLDCQGIEVSTSSLDHVSDTAVQNSILQIYDSLENPIAHFKGMDVLGGLLVLVSLWSVYCQLKDGKGKAMLSCLSRLKQSANPSVLKECLNLENGILLSCGNTQRKMDNKTSPCVGDFLCLVDLAFEVPCNLDLEFESWKWLALCLQGKQMMKEEKYSLAMAKFCKALDFSLDPEVKAQILCLLAECYCKQGCLQLAIQTYRDALRTDQSCCCVLWYLSDIYRKLGERNLELECLNLLIHMLKMERKGDKAHDFVWDTDNLIWSTFSPLIKLTVPTAMYTFANRCLLLERYKESAEQYLELVEKLQTGILFPEFLSTDQNSINVEEILVEAAEALFLSQKLPECLAVASHACSCFSVENPLEPLPDPNKIWDPFEDVNDSMDSPPLFQSQDSLSQTSFTVHSQTQKEAAVNGGPLDESVRTPSKSFDLSSLTLGSRKRLRSRDAKPAEDGKDKTKVCLLKARALLCKSDAMITSEGFTDQAVSSLSSALDVLISHPLSSDQGPSDDVPQPPSSKRQRLSCGSQSSKASPLSHQRADGNPTDHLEGSGWLSLTISTALRMAKAALERKRFSSVLNSCMLALQLDSGNVQAIYMKTRALMENPRTRRKSMEEWLPLRGVRNVKDKTQLNQALDSCKRLKSTESEDQNAQWWQINEKQMVELDLQSILFLLESR